MSRVWDIRVKEACSGWMLNLSSYHVRPRDALVFNYAKNGDIQNLKRLFDKGEASPFDLSSWGETLLHVRLSQEITNHLRAANMHRLPSNGGSRKLVASC
jgi:hypothetical protein